MKMPRDEIVVCFLNPLSNDGTAKLRWPELAATMDKRGICYELIEHQGDLSECLFEELCRREESDNLVIAGLGGDGTHMAMINGLMRFRKSFPDSIVPDYTPIPMGTGNNLAKSFNMSASSNVLRSEMRRAICATAYGARYQLDIGEFGEENFFVDAFTVGIDAHILAGRNRDRERMRGIPFIFRLCKGYPVYAVNMLKSFRKCRALRGEIEVDGKPWFSGDLFNIIINNSRIYAGEFDLTQVAFANDGKLDLLVFTGHRDYLHRYLLSHRHLPRKMRKLAYKPFRSVQHVQGEDFRIRLEKNIPAQVDGEELSPGKEFHIRIHPRSITIRVPVEPA